jgi:hypothetical protein
MEEAKAEVAGEEEEVLMKEETERKAEGGVDSDALRLRENIVAILPSNAKKSSLFWRGSASHGRGAE